MIELIFATNNLHKLTEIRKAAGKNILVRSLKEVGFDGDIPETADTLEGNASLKSWFIYHRFGKNCFADDTGLEVECLSGLPGVHSARFAGLEHDHQKNMDKLLAEMKGASNRKARFRTIISLIMDGKEHFFEGIVNGRIAQYKQGSMGFGYDPVFIPNGYRKSFAEMELAEKNALSHRGIAARNLCEFLLRV
jgi:XTP/dITP diphosphohydrolase